MTQKEADYWRRELNRASVTCGNNLMWGIIRDSKGKVGVIGIDVVKLFQRKTFYVPNHTAWTKSNADVLRQEMVQEARGVSYI